MFLNPEFWFLQKKQMMTHASVYRLAVRIFFPKLLQITFSPP